MTEGEHAEMTKGEHSGMTEDEHAGMTEGGTCGNDRGLEYVQEEFRMTGILFTGD